MSVTFLTNEDKVELAAGIDNTHKAIATEKAERKAEMEIERARINAIASLPEGSTTMDAEVADARVGYDGTLYPTAGEAIRGQVTNLHNAVNYLKNSVSGGATARHYHTFSVLGDSYSTFVDFVTPNTNLCWYPAGNENATGSNNNVAKIEQMWWHIFANEYGSALQRNNSFSGSPICFDGWGSGNTDSAETGFIARANNIGTPELIFVFGGSNDDWVNATIGEYQYADWTEEDFVSFRPALAYLLNYLKQHNAGAKIVYILNENLDTQIDESVYTICSYYDVDVLELQNIATSNGHPTVAGQASIAQQVLEFMAAGDVVIPDADVTSIIASLSQDEFFTGVTLNDLKNYLTVTANFEDGTSAVVTDYELSGELVAGENTVTITYRGVTTAVVVSVSVPSGTYQLSVDTLDASNYQYYCPVFNAKINESLRIVFIRDFELFSTNASIKGSNTLPTSLKNGGTQLAQLTYSGEYIDLSTSLTSEYNYFLISLGTAAVNPLTLRNFHVYVDDVEVDPIDWVTYGGANEITATKLS